MKPREELLVYGVDDEEGIRLGVEMILDGFETPLADVGRSVRFTIRTFETGEEFLAALEAVPPHLVLLDCKLPGIGGLEILEQRLSKRDDIVTVIVTAYATLETAVKTTKMGAFDFLAKPFTPEELRYTMRKAATHVMLKREAARLEAERHQVRFQFLQVLAHELKSPLGAVEGYLDLMENRLLGDELGSYGAVLEKCLARMGGMRKLIADLMDLTRIESGQKQRTLESLDLTQLARTALESVEIAAAKREIGLQLEAPKRLPFTGDAGELEIIFNNLISNGVKYNREGGFLRVALGCEGELVTLTVQDGGIGLSPEESAKLFGEFVRIKNAETRDIPGSGLGLSIVRKLATMYGGEARVQSEKGIGSTFTVTLKTQEMTTVSSTDEVKGTSNRKES